MAAKEKQASLEPGDDVQERLKSTLPDVFLRLIKARIDGNRMSSDWRWTLVVILFLVMGVCIYVLFKSEANASERLEQLVQLSQKVDQVDRKTDTIKVDVADIKSDIRDINHALMLPPRQRHVSFYTEEHDPTNYTVKLDSP